MGILKSKYKLEYGDGLPPSFDVSVSVCYSCADSDDIKTMAAGFPATAKANRVSSTAWKGVVCQGKWFRIEIKDGSWSVSFWNTPLLGVSAIEGSKESGGKVECSAVIVYPYGLFDKDVNLDGHEDGDRIMKKVTFTFGGC